MKTMPLLMLLSGILLTLQLLLPTLSNAAQTVTEITVSEPATPMTSSPPSSIPVNPLETDSGTVNFSDSDITYLLQKKINDDKTLAGASMTVSTQDGVVTIKGRAKNQAQVDQAAQISKSINGVKSVQTQVTIESTSF